LNEDDAPTGWKKVADNRWLLIITAATALAVIGWILLQCRYELTPGRKGCEVGDLHLLNKVTLVLFGMLIGWFFDIFTGEATKRKVHQMVAFCYVFPFAIVASILIPLFAYPEALPDPPKPFGIVLGCSERPILPVDRDLVPDGIRCFNRSDQYLFHIGGHAEPIDDTTRREREAIATQAAKSATDAIG
jgi:hypothetical protein